MRLITWNMGCAFSGSPYTANHERAWQFLLDLNPDVALLQEARPPSWVTNDGAQTVGRARNSGGSFQTLLWSKERPLEPIATTQELDSLIQGQVVGARTTDDGGQPLAVASLHAKTGEWEQEPIAALSEELRDMLPTNRDVWHSDVMLLEARRAFGQGRFVAAGDLNLAWRMDAIYDSMSPMHGSSTWFAMARDAGWLRCHLKFHAGEEQTFFRPGREREQMYQLDHVFADQATYDAASRCDVLAVEGLNDLSDHAPVILEIGEARSRARTGE